MSKVRCTVCGEILEAGVEVCPVCKAGSDKFVAVVEGETLAWADEHKIGVAQGVDPEIVEGLKANFMGECTEVGDVSGYEQTS